jgi:2-amino-4-hydroxy-6-hydroxymethyldihydropteridine diphosphokinase
LFHDAYMILLPDYQSCAFISLGSNLGDSLQIIRNAFLALQDLTCEPLLKSSLWQTGPIDCPPGSPLFINAMAGLVQRAGETPESLLAKLQALEIKAGRQHKTVLNEPRLLDLDLIAFGCEIRQTPVLVLPHPRAHQRWFVLQPLVEIAPDLLLPGQTMSVKQLLTRVPKPEILQPLEAGFRL